MTSDSRRLGRGLDTLFQNNGVAVPGIIAAGGGDESRKLNIEALMPNPNQPRRQFVEGQLDELASSIRAQGVLQPILVRPIDKAEGRYEIIAGERRWRAARQAGLTTIPVVIREMNDQEALVVALMENLQREGLNPMEEALGLQQLKDEFGLSQDDMAARLGKSRSAIANTLRLAALPDSARDDLMAGRFSAGHARALLTVTDPECQEQFRHHLAAGNCTVRDAERIAALWKETGALPEDLAVTPQKKRATVRGKGSLEQEIVAIQERIGKALSLPVSIRGGESKGRISVRYSSREELDALLERLGAVENVA